MTSGGSTPMFRHTTSATAVVFSLSFCRHLVTIPDGLSASRGIFSPCRTSENSTGVTAPEWYNAPISTSCACSSGNVRRSLNVSNGDVKEPRMSSV